MKTAWDLILEIYKTKHNLSNKIVNYISVFNILSLAVFGNSNRTISETLEQEQRYIKDVLVEFLRFYGWEDDLDFSPINLYYEINSNYNLFIKSCPLSKEQSKIAYNICSQYDKIRKEIDDEY